MEAKNFFALAILILPLLLILSACANRAAGYATTIEQEVKASNDVAASLLEDAPCAMSLGAWARMEDQRKREAVFKLCVPDAP